MTLDRWVELFPLDSATAILINRHRLTESSLIVHWCSASGGLFKTVAKGALRPRSPFAGRLDLFVTCEITFLRSTRTDLHTLREAHLTEPRLHLRESYPRVLAASYFCRLLEMVAEQESPLEDLHELLRLALDHLDSHDPSARLIVRFEDRLCAALGLGDAQGRGAGRLHDYFHRALPPQRDELFKQFTA